MLLLKSITEDPDRSKVLLADPSYIHFHYALEFDTQTLADMLDSFAALHTSRHVIDFQDLLNSLFNHPPTNSASTSCIDRNPSAPHYSSYFD